MLQVFSKSSVMAIVKDELALKTSAAVHLAAHELGVELGVASEFDKSSLFFEFGISKYFYHPSFI